MNERGADSDDSASSPWARPSPRPALHSVADVGRSTASRSTSALPATTPTRSARSTAHSTASADQWRTLAQLTQRRRERRGVVAWLWLMAVVLGFGVMAIVNGTAGSGRSADGDVTADHPVSPETGAVTDSLGAADRSPADTGPDPTDPAAETEEPAVTSAGTSPGPNDDVVPAEARNAETGSFGTSGEAQWSPERVRFPTWNLFGPEPFQLLLLAADGTLHEITFPAGIHRSIEVAGRVGAAELLVVEDFTLVQRWDVGDAVVVHDGGIVRLPRGGWTVRPGPVDELVDLWPDRHDEVPEPESAPSRYALVGNELVRVEDDALPEWGPSVWGFAPTGEPIAVDGGSVYRLDAGGVATRLSTGEVVVLGTNFVVLRECDERRSCQLVSLDRDWRRREYDLAPLTDPGDRGRFGRSFAGVPIISPDGASLVISNWRDDGRGRTARLVDIDEGSGETTTFEIELDGLEPKFAWLPDSSAVIVTERGADAVRVIHRDDGLVSWWDFRIDVVDVGVRGLRE